MAKRNNRRNGRGNRGTDESVPRLHPDTMKSIWAIASLGVAALLVLAGIGKAGPLGEWMHAILKTLVGWGYFVIPATLFVVALVFLFSSERKKIVGTTFLGAVALVLSILGVIHILAPAEGGWFGYILGSLKIPFGDTAAIVINAFVLVIAFLTTLNSPLRLDFLKKKEPGEDEEEKEIPIIVKGPREAAAGDDGDNRNGDNKNDDDKRSPPAKDEDAEAKEPEIKEAFGFALPKGKKTAARTFANYVPPPLDLLKSSSEKPTTGDLRANANIIKRTLEGFGIAVEMGEINIGPKVTRYTLKPAEGVKLSRIVALHQDLALALAAHPIRIEAPIPGKALVGIEVPNKSAALVRLGSLMAYPEFAASGPLGFVLGRDVTGEPLFANIEKMPHLLIAGATGAGKTCAANTFVFTEQGMLTFKEICPLPLDSHQPFNVKVATRDGIETTSRVYNNGICNFYKIATEEGFEVEVTAEHPLWVIDKEGVMQWRQGAEIREGDYVAIGRGSQIFGKETPINFTPRKNVTNKARAIQIPTHMTPELGLLLGLLTADGGLTVGNRVVYTQADDYLLEIYSRLLATLFGISSQKTRKSGASNKAKDIVVNSTMLKDFFSHLGMHAVGAREKEIPRAVRTARPEVIKAFLHGMMRNDGHISENTLELCLASKHLIVQTQLLLLNFGVVSAVHKKKVAAYAERDYWRLTVYGSELVKYSQVIGFLTERERVKLKDFLELQRNPNKNVVPHLSALLKKISRAYRSAFAKITNSGWHYQSDILVPKYAFANLKSYNNGDRKPSYLTLEKILHFYKPLSTTKEYRQLREIYDKKFYWARVKSIGRTEGEGYDFEVPGSNSFVGNGFVNHNSVMIHSLLLSLIYKNSPATLKMILIDPKRVELSMYENLPHLVSPVITESKKSVGVFRWAVSEMDRRYDLLQSAGSRDIKSYNANGGKDDPLPYLVIIVDELADLMTSYGREVEGSIVRLAQMARATGIHLVLSTQRPSVEVITGLIKANITSRIALQVASQIDSRTILDTGGAEKLLGGGDLLFVSSDLSKPKRIQGCYVTEEEIGAVSDFIREHNPLDFGGNSGAVDFAGPKGENGSGGKPKDASSIFDGFANDGDDDDELYDEAIETVKQAQKASASLLQRRLKVGYARAARLLDLMEARGAIGPGEGAKPREVFVEGGGEQISRGDFDVTRES